LYTAIYLLLPLLFLLDVKDGSDSRLKVTFVVFKFIIFMAVVIREHVLSM
jgi:heme/copper-type cytochrome/quinol oxidase subunit 4